ncbi:MAG: K+/H+ antiporter subunit F [Burkholderiales bacterium]|jgi:multicomponent K+:H+ antiporter subunit F|nr:K+/H+ antiporter subunit F [Burkholderiales bacterium]
MILPYVLPWAAGALTLAMLLAGWRLLRGPALPDRMLALDALYITSLALLIVLGMAWGTQLFFEAALVVAMLGFVCTAVLSKFFLRGDVVE